MLAIWGYITYLALKDGRPSGYFYSGFSAAMIAEVLENG